MVYEVFNRRARCLAAFGLLSAVALATPRPVAACLPLDPPADFSFADGLSLAFAGTVATVRDDPELGVRRVDIVIEVEHVIAGNVPAQVTITRATTQYCHSLLYEVGDQVVVAGGLPGPSPDLEGWSEEPDPRPPFNRYQVAVWGPFATGGSQSDEIGPTLDGRPVPLDQAQLIALLAALPDTAMAEPQNRYPTIGASLVLAAAFAAAVTITAKSNRSRPSTPR